MRWNVPRLPALIAALLAIAASRAAAQAPPAQPDPRRNADANANAAPGAAQRQPPPIDPRRIEDLLRQWEQNSANLRTLDVRMARVDHSDAWDENERYEGRAMFKSPNRAWLDFQKERDVKDPKPGQAKTELVPHERIICTGSEVWQFSCSTRQVFIYPLEKDVQLRALEEGPLPFLFNFKVADAKKRYEMALVAEDADTATIRIVPRLPIDQQNFKLAVVTLDRRVYLLPRRIFLVRPDGKSSQDFRLDLSRNVANCEVMDVNFAPQVVKGWKVVRNPVGEDPAAGGGRVAQPRQAPAGAAPPPDQPAMRPRLFQRQRN
jgi:TIGR03009 family protein